MNKATQRALVRLGKIAGFAALSAVIVYVLDNNTLVELGLSGIYEQALTVALTAILASINKYYRGTKEYS